MRKIRRAVDGDGFKSRFGQVLKQGLFPEDTHFQSCARPAVENQVTKLLDLAGPGHVLRAGTRHCPR